MTTRAYIAGRAREVGAMLSRCENPPTFILDDWRTLWGEVQGSLHRDEDARARRLVDLWADEALEVLSTRLLHEPLDRAGEAA